MVALDEALVTLDPQRRTTYRVERGGKLHKWVAAAPAEGLASPCRR